MNYWQITASHVQRSAPGQPAAKPSRPGSTLPVQSQTPEVSQRSSENRTLSVEALTEDGLAPKLSFEEMYTRHSSQLPAGGGSDRASDKVMRMMQVSPNLTMEQVKAILKVDRFE